MASSTRTQDTTNPEAAVRRYLNYLSDPTSVIDHDRVEEVQAELSATDDQIERLRLESELDRVRSTDGESVVR